MKTKRTITLAAMALLCTSAINAASFSSLVSSSTVQSVVSAVTSSSTSITTSSIAGTWTYSGTAVELESDNFLTSAAGSLATSTVESKLDDYCSKVGILAGTFSFTFGSDNSFSCTCSGKSLSGTYALNTDGDQITLNFTAVSSVSLGSMDANISLSSGNLLILFQADKLLELISTVSSVSDNSSLQTINSLLSNYDGVQLGFDLAK